MRSSLNSSQEWLEADGLGGFASGTATGIRTRRYHALLLNLLEPERARLVVDAVERELLTPLGLRSLAPNSSEYVPHYVGDVRERDGSYHQGTVWPWLMGPFVEAWVRVRGETNAAKREARSRFLDPLLRHVEEAGLGHISEIADGAPPHMPRGCPFQAWSVGEALRLDRVVLAKPVGRGVPAEPPSATRKLVAA